MKLTNLTLFLLLCGFSLFAQDNGGNTSPEVKITKSNSYPVIASESQMYYPIDDDNLLVLKIQGKKQNKFVFQIFSGPNLNLKSTKTELMEDKGLYFEHIVKVKDNMYFFYTIYDKVTTTEQLFARRINTGEGGFDGEPQLLITAHQKISESSYFRYLFSGEFDIDVLGDQETFVVKYKNNPQTADEEGGKDVYGIQVFDADLKKVWGDEFEMPYAKDRMDYEEFIANSHGKAYFLVKKYKEAKTWGNYGDRNNESFSILIAHSGGSIDEVELNLGEYQTPEVEMKENQQGEMVCAGYYCKPNSKGVKGAFVSILDAKGNLSGPKWYEFSADLIQKYGGNLHETRQKRTEKEGGNDPLVLDQLYLSNIDVLEDGGIVISGQIFYSVCGARDSRGNARCVDHFDDVIVIKVNENGDLGWMQRLPKRSRTESFRLLTTEKNTYIIFIDNLKNTSLAENQEPSGSFAKERFMIAYRMNNETGERKHLILFENRKIDGTPVDPYILYPYTPFMKNAFVFELYTGKNNEMMFKVAFEE